MTASEYKICPNCSKKLGGILSSNYILEKEQVIFINLFKQDKSESYCYDCGHQLLLFYKSELNKKRSKD